MAVEHEGVLLVNPGAIASPNFTSRQRLQSVAIFAIRDDGAPFVTHIDLAHPDRPFVPRIDWEAGFLVAHRQFGAPILTPELAADFPRIFDYGQEMVPESGWAVYRRLAHRCWSGAQEAITCADALAAFRDDGRIAPEAKAEIVAALRGAESLIQ